MSWPDVRLKDVCHLVVDCVNKTAPIVEYETPYKMLRTTNVRGGFVDVDNVRYVTEETFEKWTRRAKLEKGDVILTREAPLGDVGRLTSDDNVFLGQRLFQYRANPKVLDSLFLAYVLQSPLVQGRFKSKGFGATVQHAKVGDCENLEIPLPKIETQRSIGSILSAYDDLIENNRRRIQLLEESARLLYKEWFVHLRFPGHEHVKIQDGVPEGWVRKPLGEILEIKKGKNITQATVEEGDVPVVAGGLGPAYFHSEANVSGPVITVSASGANAGYVALYQQDIWASDCSYIGVEIEPNLYFRFLQLKNIQEAIFAMQHGAAQPHVYPKDLARLVVVQPTDKLLKDFLDVVSSQFILIRRLNEANKHLEKARDILLPRLMNGELAV